MPKDFSTGSIVWLATTLGLTASMVIALINYINKAGIACREATEPFSRFAASSLVIPSSSMNVTLQLPKVMSTILGQQVTVMPGTEVTVPMQFPGATVQVGSLIGEAAVKFLREDLPKKAEEICRKEIAMHGIAYIAIVLGLGLLTTYAYTKNHQLTLELKKQRDNDTHSRDPHSISSSSISSLSNSPPSNSSSGPGSMV